MAFSVDDKVRVADESSAYRGHRGVVQAVSSDLHDVRLEGFGCSQVVQLLTGQLKADTRPNSVSYAMC